MSLHNNSDLLPNENFLSLPYGFQTQGLYNHSSKHCDIQAVTYNSKSKKYIILDSRGVTSWFKTSALNYTKRLLDFEGYKFNALKDICYCRMFNVYFVLTKEYQLKVYNLNFHETFTVESDGMPVSCLMFNNKTKELVTTGINEIRYWKFDIIDQSRNALVISRKHILPDIPFIRDAIFDQILQRVYLLCDYDIWCFGTNGQKQFRIKHTSFFSACAFSFEASLLITGTISGEICIFSTTGGLVKSLCCHSQEVSTILVHPADGNMCITASKDGTIKLLSLQTLSGLYSLTTNIANISSMTINNDIIYCSSTKSIELFNLNYTFQFWSTVRSIVKSVQVTSKYLPKSLHVVAHTDENSIRIYEQMTGNNKSTILPPPELSLLDEIKSISYDRLGCVVYVLFSDKEFWIYSTKTDPATRVATWSIDSFTSLDEINEDVVCKCLTTIPRKCEPLPDDEVNNPYRSTKLSFLICGLSNGSLMYIDPYKGEKTFYITLHRNYPILEIESNIGNNVVTIVTLIQATNGRQLQMWDASSFSLLYSITVQPQMTAYCFKPSICVVGYENGYLKLHEFCLAENGVDTKSFDTLDEIVQDHTGSIISIDILKEQQLICSCAQDRFIRIWDFSKTLLTEIKLDSSLCFASFLDSTATVIIGFKNNLFTISSKYLELCEFSFDDISNCSDESTVFENPYIKNEIGRVYIEDNNISLTSYLNPYSHLNLPSMWYIDKDISDDDDAVSKEINGIMVQEIMSESCQDLDIMPDVTHASEEPQVVESIISIPSSQMKLSKPFIESSSKKEPYSYQYNKSPSYRKSEPLLTLPDSDDCDSHVSETEIKTHDVEINEVKKVYDEYEEVSVEMCPSNKKSIHKKTRKLTKQNSVSEMSLIEQIASFKLLANESIVGLESSVCFSDSNNSSCVTLPLNNEKSACNVNKSKSAINIKNQPTDVIYKKSRKRIKKLTKRIPKKVTTKSIKGSKCSGASTKPSTNSINFPISSQTSAKMSTQHCIDDSMSAITSTKANAKVVSKHSQVVSSVLLPNRSVSSIYGATVSTTYVEEPIIKEQIQIDNINADINKTVLETPNLEEEISRTSLFAAATGNFDRTISKSVSKVRHELANTLDKYQSMFHETKVRESKQTLSDKTLIDIDPVNEAEDRRQVFKKSYESIVIRFDDNVSNNSSSEHCGLNVNSTIKTSVNAKSNFNLNMNGVKQGFDTSTVISNNASNFQALDTSISVQNISSRKVNIKTNPIDNSYSKVTDIENVNKLSESSSFNSVELQISQRSSENSLTENFESSVSELDVHQPKNNTKNQFLLDRNIKTASDSSINVPTYTGITMAESSAADFSQQACNGLSENKYNVKLKNATHHDRIKEKHDFHSILLALKAKNVFKASISSERKVGKSSTKSIASEEVFLKEIVDPLNLIVSPIKHNHQHDSVDKLLTKFIVDTFKKPRSDVMFKHRQIQRHNKLYKKPTLQERTEVCKHNCKGKISSIIVPKEVDSNIESITSINSLADLRPVTRVSITHSVDSFEDDVNSFVSNSRCTSRRSSQGHLSSGYGGSRDNMFQIHCYKSSKPKKRPITRTSPVTLQENHNRYLYGKPSELFHHSEMNPKNLLEEKIRSLENKLSGQPHRFHIKKTSDEIKNTHLQLVYLKGKQRGVSTLPVTRASSSIPHGRQQKFVNS